MSGRASNAAIVATGKSTFTGRNSPTRLPENTVEVKVIKGSDIDS